MSKPHRGTTKHVNWMTDKVLKVAEKLGIPVSDLPRDTFLAEVDEGVTRTDIDSCMAWTHLKTLAVQRGPGIHGPLKNDELPLTPVVPPGYYVKGVKTQVNSKGETEKQWLHAPLAHAEGTLTDQIPDGHVVSGVSTLVSGSGHTLAQWVKTRKESKEDLLAATLNRVLAEIPRHAPAREDLIPSPKTSLDSELLACIVLGDGHIGLCSWAPETGADWDLKIAEDMHKAAVSDLVARGPNAETGMLVELGDWLDSDGVNNTTTSGTPQDTDTRWSLVVGVGLRILVHAVDCMLSKHKTVIVDICQGNHNRSTSTIFAHYVAAWYRNEPRVKIVMDPSTRHYHQWGTCLIGTTHGDGPKVKELPEIMAAEVPEIWGQTRHRRWFVGHVHHSQAIEHRGCTVETFRTLSPRSGWAAAKGYVSGRDASRITYHKKFGEISREICSAEYLSESSKR